MRGLYWLVARGMRFQDCIRDKEVEKFRCGETQVFFATLGAMNSSNDLYEAKALVLYDPWWNPQRENQGIGRMVRRGPEEETTVYRMFSPNDVEGLFIGEFAR